MDLDKDGTISLKDAVGMAERSSDVGKVDPSQKETMKQYYGDIFSRLTKTTGSSDDVLLTEDLFLESMKLLKDDPAFKKAIGDATHNFLTTMHENQDGYLDFAKFRRVFESGGMIDSDFTKEAFNALDGDQDGKLSFEEFTHAITDYVCSDKEGTTAMFGLLV